MWTTDYESKGVRGYIVSGGMAQKEEMIGFDVGDTEVIDMILNRDPAIFDYLVDVIKNVKDVSDLMWSYEAYYIMNILPEKYDGDTDAVRERVEYLISIAGNYKNTGKAVENLTNYLAWMKEEEAKAAQRAANKAKTRTVRQELQRDYDRLFMQIGRRDGFSCVVCGCSTELTIDHKIAVSNGGTNDLDNLQLMCMADNRAKGAK